MSKKKKDKTIEDYEKLKKIFSAFSSPITRKPVWTRKTWKHFPNYRLSDNVFGKARRSPSE